MRAPPPPSVTAASHSPPARGCMCMHTSPAERARGVSTHRPVGPVEATCGWLWGAPCLPAVRKPGTAPWRSAQRLLPRPAPTKLLGAGGGSERPRRRGGRPPPFLFRAPPACGLGPILRPRPSPTAPTSRQQDPEPPAGCVTGRLLPLRTSPATNGVGPRCPGTGRANAAAAGHDRSGYRELHC